jgi:hypothetical protein
MEQIILAFTYPDDYQKTKKGFVLSKIGAERAVSLQNMISNTFPTGLGGITVRAELSNRSNINALMFTKLRNCNPANIRYFCGECETLAFDNDALGQECDTEILFDYSSGDTLVKLYDDLIEVHGLMGTPITKKNLSAGDLLGIAIVFDDETVLRMTRNVEK